MCGIAGIFGITNKHESEALVNNMNHRMAHRGPDDHGVYADELVALGHRRLAILDLSPAGHQPMFADSGNLVIVFNGEIYNFREIRETLTGHHFTSESDTEVILEAYRRYGKDCVHLFNGMFAFAIWDRKRKELFIARDRLGIKPVYYYHQKGITVFSSEIRSLLASELIPRKINRQSIAEYFTYQTVHAPETILQEVMMLMPGHHLTISENSFSISKYWDPVTNASKEPVGKSYDAVCSDIRSLFEASVKRRLISDVPFGAFLSGGIDSSAVVGQMSKVQNQPVRTFNISFDEGEFGEAKYARLIAERFGTEHHELLLTPADFLTMLPDALRAIDHPSGDGPNSYVVSKITRENGITMALSGLGGDELFAGYPVFNRTMRVMNHSWIWKLPAAVRQVIGDSIVTLRPGIQGIKLRQLLMTENADVAGIFPISRQTQPPSEIARLISFDLPADRVSGIVTDALREAGSFGVLSKVSVAEMVTYMQNVLLRDTDQMSMASALEVRVPFLDYKLVEYVLGVNDAWKNPVYPKKLLVESLGDLLPPEIVHRKKMGFSFPWVHWIRNELRSFCDERIRSLARREFMNGGELISRWEKFLKNDPSVRWPDIWTAVVLENWIQENKIES